LIDHSPATHESVKWNPSFPAQQIPAQGSKNAEPEQRMNVPPPYLKQYD